MLTAIESRLCVSFGLQRFGAVIAAVVLLAGGLGSALADPICEVSPTSLDFGAVLYGSSADRSFVVRNVGDGDLIGFVEEVCDAYELIAGGGEFTLAGGETLAVTVHFQPPEPGDYPCIVSTGTELCAEVTCTGAGLPPGLFWYEPFSYPDGDLTIQSGHLWNTHSGTGLDIQIVDSVAVGDMSSFPDDNRLFPAPGGPTDTTYAAFRVKIPAVTGIPGTNYFAHFRIGNSFPSKIWVTAADTTFTFGVTVGGNSLTPPVGDVWPEALNYDEWYTVATSYDAALGVSRLWVNPVDENSPSIAATDASWTGKLIESFALRQSNTAAVLWRYHVDDLRVGSAFAAVVPPASDVAGDPVSPRFAFSPIRPNPVRNSATIGFDLPVAQQVELAILDAAGRQVRQLVSSSLPAGRYQFRWDGLTADGTPAASGVYFCRLHAGGVGSTKSIVVLK